MQFGILEYSLLFTSLRFSLLFWASGFTGLGKRRSWLLAHYNCLLYTSCTMLARCAFVPPCLVGRSCTSVRGRGGATTAPLSSLARAVRRGWWLGAAACSHRFCFARGAQALKSAQAQQEGGGELQPDVQTASPSGC